MLINLRNALMSGKRLPYDAEVEYLEFTGTQRLLTDITPNVYGRNLKTSISYQLTSTASRQLSGSGSSYFEFCSNRALVQADASYPADLNRHTLDFIGWEASSSSRVLYDGQNIAQDGFIRSTNTSNHFTFGSLNANSQSNPLKAKVYSLSMGYQDGTKLLDWVPVRVGTTGYMYDRVSGKLFGNAGTGDFVVGSDVVPVEYIESHGTEYIDTGYVPNMNSVFDVTFSPNNVDFVGHPVHGNAYAATNKYTSSTVCPLTLWTGNNYNNRFFYAPVAMNGLVVGQKYHIVQSAASLSRDGVVVGNYDSSQMRTPLVEPMWLFACMNTQTERLYGLLRMYSWNVSELGISMRSMLPVRVGTDATSWEGAMMDVLTRRIYRNAGTGAFGYGNDLRYPIPAE